MENVDMVILYVMKIIMITIVLVPCALVQFAYIIATHSTPLTVFIVKDKVNKIKIKL